MNSKNLIVTFVAVSAAALIVSSLAVFTVARRYAAELFASRGEEIAQPPGTSSAPDEGISQPAANVRPESDAAASEESTAEQETEAAPVTSETACEATEAAEAAEAADTSPSFTLILSGDRLVILSPEGERVYERIVNAAELREGDRAVLTSGISFPDAEDAMSAVYDLIS